jgi:hypothetical protein
VSELSTHEHNWPQSGGHMWTHWMNKSSREGTKPPTRYRICVHPDCTASEEKETGNA